MILWSQIQKKKLIIDKYFIFVFSSKCQMSLCHLIVDLNLVLLVLYWVFEHIL